MAGTAELVRAYWTNPTDPRFQGAYGSDAWKTSTSGGTLRTSFADENDFNRYYGLDYGGNMWANPNGTYGKYGPTGGSGSEESAGAGPEYFNAPKWNSGLLAPAVTPPATPGTPAAPAAPAAPGTPSTPATPAAPPPAAQDRSVATYEPGSATASTASAGTATGYGYTAESWDAYLREVGFDELSRNQLGVMLDENGAYVRRAQTRGMQTAQARGLLNSSLAAGAAHAAAIDAAQPFALQDAATYAKQALANQDMENKARSENASAINRASEVTANNKTQASVTNANNATQVSVANANNSTQVSIANTAAKNAALQAEAAAKNEQAMQVLKGEQAETLARIDADAKAQVQRTASTAAIVAQGSQNITTIMASKDLSAAQQQAGVDKQTTLMDYSLKLVNGSSNLDLPKLY